jgi:hypothetical protein
MSTNPMSTISKFFLTLFLCFERSLRGFRKVRLVPSIAININEMKHVRTLREIFILFDISKYEVDYRARFNRWTFSILRHLKWHPNVTLIWQHPHLPVYHFILTDDQTSWQGGNSNGLSKMIWIHYDYQPKLDLGSDHYVMPIPMHPQIYCQYKDHNRLAEFRKMQKKIRIFFAGYWSAEFEGEMKTKYGKLSRNEIIEHLLHRESTKLISNVLRLEGLLEGDYHNAFFILDRTLRINQEKWLRTLCRADFFLCPPGNLWSHNAVEAMAVGTIPLINYPEWFYPELVEGENCIKFESTIELDARIKKIFEMGESEIGALHERVCAYYEKNLNPIHLVDKMVNGSDHMHLHIWDVP